MTYVIFRCIKKLNFKFLNRPLVIGVENDNLEPLFKSQFTSILVIKIAVNKEVIIPINSVVAKPLIGPVPKV